MEQREIRAFVKLLGKMAELETAVSGFYAICARRTKDDDFWGRLAEDEGRHANHLKDMAKVVTDKNGAGFSAGRPFTTEATAKLIDYVEHRTQEAKKGSLSGGAIVSIAHELERQLRDARYGEVVKTLDEDYLKLMERVEKDTALHVIMLEARLKPA